MTFLLIAEILNLGIFLSRSVIKYTTNTQNFFYKRKAHISLFTVASMLYDECAITTIA